MEDYMEEKAKLDSEAKEDRQNEKTNSGVFKQIFYAFVIASTALQLGMVTGWSGILMKMRSDASATVVVSEDDATWLVSLLGLVWTFSSLVAGPLMEFVGLRRLLLFSLLPSSLCWVMLAHPLGLWAVYAGRIGTCVLAGLFNSILQPLLAELSRPRHRGFVLTLPEILVSVGLLASYALARFLPWRLATFLLAAPFVPLFFLMLAVPESPYWLLRRNRVEEVEKVLRCLDPTCDVEEEVLAMKSTCTKEMTFSQQVQQLRERHHIRPVLLVLAVFLLREAGGPSIIFMYSAYMFSLAGVSMDAFTCSILVGVVRLSAVFVSAFVSDGVGRRAMMLGTAVTCAVSQAVAGGYLLLDQGDTRSDGGILSYLPLVAVLVFTASNGIGLAPIPWVLVGELLPTPVRALGAALVSATYALTVFAINFVFPVLIDALSLGGTFLLFASINAALALLVFVLLPESSGLTLEEVQVALARKFERHSKEAQQMVRSSTPTV